MTTLSPTTAKESRRLSDKSDTILSATSNPSNAVVTDARLGRETTNVTVSIAPVSSLRQYYIVEHPSALNNAHVRRAMHDTFEICHSDEGYDRPDGTRAKVSSMLSRHNRQISDAHTEHWHGVSDRSAARTGSKLCVLQLAPKDVDIQDSITDDFPDDLYDVPGYLGRMDYHFELIEDEEYELVASVEALYDDLQGSKRYASGRGLEESHKYHERDDETYRPSKDERTGLLILEEKNRHRESV